MKKKYIHLKVLIVTILSCLLYMQACRKPGIIVQHGTAAGFSANDISSTPGAGAVQVFTLAGDGTTGVLNSPAGVVRDATGNIYVSDAANNRILKIDPTGNRTTFAGSGAATLVDGRGKLASFNAPAGLAMDAAGNIIVADKGNNCIRKITPDSIVTTIAGASNADYIDGGITTARFNSPSGVAVDTAGNNILVADTKNQCLRAILLGSNQVITLAGKFNQPDTTGGTLGQLGSTRLRYPFGVTIDAFGNILITDSSSIRRIINGSGMSTTLAGSGSAGFNDATGAAAQFNGAAGITTDTAGNAYVADCGNNRIRKVTPAGAVTTFAGNGNALFLDGAPTVASFKSPTGILVDASGGVYVADAGNNRIRKVAFVTTEKTIEAGMNNSFFIKPDNSLWAIGYNVNGELGDGTNTTKTVPVKVMDNVLAVAAGAYHTLVLKTDNSVWATGSNHFGQLGNGTNTDRNTFVKVMDNVKVIRAGWFHSLFIKEDNSLWAVGDDDLGELGDGNTVRRVTRNIPIKVMDNVKTVAAGDYNSFIIKTDNTLWAVGDNGYGKLGNSTYDGYEAMPVKIMDNAKDVAAGNYHSVFLKTDNTVWTVGWDVYGQLGDGAPVAYTDIPFKAMDNVKAISSGYYHTLMLKTDNSLWAMGYNYTGTLGNGSPDYGVVFPVKVMDNVKSMSGGGYHSLLCTIGNTIPFAVGGNGYWELCDGTNQQRNSWVSVVFP